MGSGVAGALRGGAGGRLNEAAVLRGPVDLREVAITDACDLDAKYVIHAAAMPHYGDGQATPKVSEARQKRPHGRRRSRLSIARDPGARVWGCGGRSRDGGRISGKTIADHELPPLSEVRFIAYSDAEFETVRKATAGFRGDR